MVAKYFMRSTLAAFLSFWIISSGQAQDGATTSLSASQERKVPTPTDLGSSGAFSYSVPFEVPVFRGMEPKLTLGYNSANRSNGAAENVLGIGWQLDGISSIARRSFGGGAPTFTDVNDTFRLDGNELLACAGATYDLPYTQAYPLDRTATRPNASCSSGGVSAGNMTALRENYLRIRSVQSTINALNVRHFVVTDKSGTTYTYRALGVLAGQAPTSANFNQLFNRIWLLQEVRDRQGNANIVRYEYAFDGANGWAHRIIRISYGKFAADGVTPAYAYNYNIHFLYSAQTKALASFLEGRGIAALGEQIYRLNAVVVRNGGTTVGTGTAIRGYRMNYALSGYTDRLLVASVNTFGNDLLVSATTITGGNQLPPYTFTYSEDDVRFRWNYGTPYNDKPAHTVNTVADTDNDGRDEAIYYGYNYSYPSSTGMSLLKKHYEFDASYGIADITTTALSTRIPATSYAATSTSYTQKSNLGIVTNWARKIDGIHEPGAKYMLSQDVSRSFSTPHSWTSNIFRLTPISVSGTAQTVTFLPTDGAFDTTCIPNDVQTPLMGNFDSEPGLELVYLEKYVNIANGAFSFQDSRRGDLENYCTSRKLGGNEWVADIDGDGIDEIINVDRFYRYESGAFKQHALPNAPLPCEYYSTTLTGCATAATTSGWQHIVTFGDVNGDGASDAVINMRKSGSTDKIKVALSTGSGFLAATEWIDTAEVPGGKFGDISARNQIADINGDGLGDLVWFKGYQTGASLGANPEEPYSLHGELFISTGSGFLRHKSPVDGLYGFCGTTFCIESTQGVGDFNGDGKLDILSGSGSGSGAGVSNPEARHLAVYYFNAPTPNVLIKVDEPMGKEISVSFGSSGQFTDNLLPRVQQLVTSVTERDGRSTAAHTTTYEYSGGRFNYDHRTSMGFKVVTATLPKIGTETNGPRVKTDYFMTMAAAGRVQRKEVLSGSLTAPILESVDEIGGASTLQSDGLPFSFNRNWDQQGLRHGSTLIYTRKAYRQTEYGEPLSVIDYGFVTADGTNANSADDTITISKYMPNLTYYIVNRPSEILVQLGSGIAEDITRRLHAKFYHYDGAASHTSTPTRGNETQLRVWTGDPAGDTSRRLMTSGYDTSGNVTTQIDARGVVTTHTYDAAKALFRMSTTNALAQPASTTWNDECQKPATVADLNALITTYSYDLFCRETEQLFPNAQYLRTTYNALGNAAAQHIRRESKSGSFVAGATIAYTWEYFDGFGSVYKTAKTGTTSAQTNAITTLADFDLRRNLSWKSIPLSWADASSNWVGNGKRTSYSYDALNRLTDTVGPDGAATTTDYTVSTFISAGTTAMAHPGARVRDAHCYDSATELTVCGDSYSFVDAGGRKVRDVLVDVDHSDVYAGTYQGRNTNYYYDRLGQLTGINDPEGADWAYDYDFFGNRTTGTDPGLGTWTMTYDGNHNLLTQTDAALNVISFAYDPLNRVTLKTVGSGAARVETRFTYDEVRTGYFNKGHETSQEVWTPLNTGTVVELVERDYHNNGKVQVERHAVDGRTYSLQYSYTATGEVHDQRLPDAPGTVGTGWVGSFVRDAAGRLTGMSGHITSITRDLWGNALRTEFVNTTATAAYEIATYSPNRGWLIDINGYDSAGDKFVRASYERSATGRISAYDSGFTWDAVTSDRTGAYAYTYDYAGRLLTATNTRAETAYDEVYSYDRAGRMRTKGQTVATDVAYTYGGTGSNTLPVPFHAPRSVGSAIFAYDKNGNMLTGLGGKIMTYDRENRPLSVTFNGKRTCYVYGADGARLKKVENLATTQSCAALPATAPVTLYFGPVEIRNFKNATTEQIITYPHPSVRRVYTGAQAVKVSYLHLDHLGSVRAITNTAGQKIERATYRPFGGLTEWLAATNPAPETKGWIGERFDADAGLQYLNARYYDPSLAMFIQPDWWEVMQAGVGTNRYSYAGNDPVNARDPGGNSSNTGSNKPGLFERGGFFDRLFGGDNRRTDSDGDGVNDWAEYQRDAAANGGGLSFDRFQAMTGINLSAGFDRRAQAYRQTDRIPDGISDKIYVNRNLSLTIANGILTGAVGFNCSASSGWCGNFVREAFLINRSYGSHAINIAFSLSSNGLISVERGALNGGGLWESAAQKITINRGNLKPGFFGDTVRHEVGHMLGLQHQENSTDRLMSYSSDKPSFFSDIEVERLINAYQ